ncbi:MAG: hypothetical protein Q9162_000210 [Coniocarpon cinnabarinum]
MVGIVVEAIHESHPNSAFFASCDPDVPCITPGTYAFLGAGAALSGIMHITVSVVVIMFELTGALTYILPTMVRRMFILLLASTFLLNTLQIVVGVTKAVGERFGKGGIADRMIWFNGFPFLDNKEEHSFGVSVSKVMVTRERLTALPVSGMTLRQVERTLATSDFQGFPIVQNLVSNNLVGYIGKTELRYAVERAKRDTFVPPDANCLFSAQAASALDPDSLQTPVTPVTSGLSATTPAPVFQSNPFESSNNDSDASFQPALDLSRFPDFTPLSVHPGLPLETVMELFKKLGPRVILVEYHGALAGLVTVKDCLKYQFTAEAAEHTRENARLAAKEEKLWGWIRKAARWTQGKVRGWTKGRIILGEPGEAQQRVERRPFVHRDGDSNTVRTEFVIDDEQMELEDRFPGGGTGSS